MQNFLNTLIKDAQHWEPSDRCKLNHNEIPPHTSENGHHKQIKKQVLETMWRKENPSALLVGMQTGACLLYTSDAADEERLV